MFLKRSRLFFVFSKNLGRFPKRVPFIPQMSSSECGAACLAMIGKAWGRPTAVREIREILDIGRDGATVLEISQAAEILGFSSKIFRSNLAGLSQLKLPAILHWNFSHFVILERTLRDKGAIIVDPAKGRSRVNRQELSNAFTGIAIQFYPVGDVWERGNNFGSPIFRFLKTLVRSHRSFFLQLILISLFLQLVVFLPSFLTSFAIDKVVKFKLFDLFNILIMSGILIIVTQFVFTLSRSLLFNYIQARIDKSLMRDFFNHLLLLPYKYFAVRTSGDLTMRLSSSSSIRDLITTQLLSFVVDGLFALVYIFGLLFMIPMYGLIVLIVGMVQVLVLVIVYTYLKELTDRDIMAQAELQSYSVESL